MALRSSGFTGLIDYHPEWVRNSGISDRSAIAPEHKFLLKLMRSVFEIDPLDVNSLSSGGLIIRRIFQIEMATKRNPKQSDFAGLDIMVGTQIDNIGAARASSPPRTGQCVVTSLVSSRPYIWQAFKAILASWPNFKQPDSAHSNIAIGTNLIYFRGVVLAAMQSCISNHQVVGAVVLKRLRLRDEEN